MQLLPIQRLFSLVLLLAALIYPIERCRASLADSSGAVTNINQATLDQIYQLQLAIQNRQLTAEEFQRTNGNQLTARMGMLEDTIASHHGAALEKAQKSQQITLITAAVLGALMLGFQWLAFMKIAAVTARQNAFVTSTATVQQLAAPGRDAVDATNRKLVEMVSTLEKRILELEDGQKLLLESPVVHAGKSLDEVQHLIEGLPPTAALERLESFLANHPDHAPALVKKAATLEKLDRADEALTHCDRAIAVDGKFALAHLQKGGLLNRLRRYDEALECFEHALAAQGGVSRVN